MSNKTLIKSIVVLTVICVVISAALAVVNSFTAPIIEAAAIERENTSRQQALPEASKFEALPLENLPESISGAYLGLDASGEPVGYVYTSSNRGFDGIIQVMTAINMDGKIVQVVTLDVTSETATLGGMTAKESYTSMYTGKDAALDGVDVISGATITSKAYEQCVLDAFEAYSVKEG